MPISLLDFKDEESICRTLDKTRKECYHKLGNFFKGARL